MVCKERSHDFRSDVLGRRIGIRQRGCRPIVDRLIEPEFAIESLSNQLEEIRNRGCGVDETCECCGVWRNDEIVGKSAFQSQTRDAERLVLVIALSVGECERGLGDTPGNATLPSVLDLPPHVRPAALIEQRSWIAAQ